MKKLLLMAAFAGLLGSTVVANTKGDDKDKGKKDKVEDKLENKKGYSPLIFTKKKKRFRRVKFNLPQSILRKTTLEEQIDDEIQ